MWVAELCLANLAEMDGCWVAKQRGECAEEISGSALLLATAQEWSPHLPGQELKTQESASRLHLLGFKQTDLDVYVMLEVKCCSFCKCSLYSILQKQVHSSSCLLCLSGYHALLSGCSLLWQSVTVQESFIFLFSNKLDVLNWRSCSKLLNLGSDVHNMFRWESCCDKSSPCSGLNTITFLIPILSGRDQKHFDGWTPAKLHISEIIKTENLKPKDFPPFLKQTSGKLFSLSSFFLLLCWTSVVTVQRSGLILHAGISPSVFSLITFASNPTGMKECHSSL